MKKITILAAVVALLGSCAQNTEDTINPNSQAEGRTIYATFDNEEEETKTYVENYKYIRWHEGDEISFFDATTYNSQYAFAGKTGDAEGEFNAVEAGEGTAIATTYGVYPYDANTTISTKGVISVALPAIQAYGVHSFGKGANTMVAVGESATDDKLFFKNACGYLVVKLYNENGATVKSVVLKGNKEEKIAGAATITATHTGVPSVTMADTATTAVTIDCGEGVEIGTTTETATEFWFVLPEITFESGITITVTDIENKEFEKTTSKPIVILRNNAQPMKAVGAEFKATKPANNEIWYTATEKITPSKTGVFGANIVSNEWNSTTGEGVITFDGNVTSVGDYAFSYCKNLKKIALPETISSIGSYAFQHCENLVGIHIPANVTSIKSYTFYYCSNMETVNIPNGVTSIASNAFCECSMLQNVTIPNSVKTIWDRAFYGCSGIETITIGSGVTSFGKEAFSGCSGELNIYCNIPSKSSEYYREAPFYNNKFSRVIVGDEVGSIGENAFRSSGNLKDVIIGKSVTEIDYYAFYQCSSLESITIGENVQHIRGYAFKDCSKLASVYCKPTTPPSLSSGSPVFANNASTLKIYVPKNNVEAYKSATTWKTLAIEGYDFE